MRRYVLVFGLLVFVSTLHGQYEKKKVTYSYDASGNRLTQTPIEIKLSSRKPKDNVADTTQVATDMGTRRVVVYPNPTKGALALELQNEPNEEESLLQLYDLNGRLLLTHRSKQHYIPLDLKSYKRGVYLLRLTIGKDRLEYKIIKE